MLFLIVLLSALPGQSFELPKKDEILEVAELPLPLRESTPDSQLGEKAAQTGWVKRGETVRVLDSKQYISIFGTEIWLEVAKLGEGGAHGWVYAGMSQEIQSGKGKLVPAGSRAEAGPAGPTEDLPKAPASLPPAD